MSASQSLLADQLRRYGSVASWLWKDALWRFKWQALAVVLAAAGGVAAQGAVLGALLQYGRALERDRVIEWNGIAIVARESLPLLYTVVAGVVVLLVLAAVLQYLGRAGGVRLDGRYEAFVSGRALEMLHRTPVAAAALDPSTAEAGQYLAQGAPREMGRLLRISLLLMTPVITALAAGLGLFVLQWELTLLVAVLSACAAALLYRTNLAAVAHTRNQVTYNPRSSRLKKDFIRRWAGRPHPGAGSSSLAGEVEDVMSQRDVVRAGQAYVNRITVVDRATFITRAVAAVTIGAVTAVQGTQILSSQQGFSTLVLYVLALRVFLNSVSTVGRTLTSVNRFYPALQSYAQFAIGLQRIEAQEPQRASLMVLAPHAGGDTESGPAVGADCAVLSNGPVDRYLVGRIAQATTLVEAVRGDDVWFAGRPTVQLDGMTLREAYDLPQEVTAAQTGLVAEIARLPPSHPFRLPLTDPDTPVGAEVWQRFPAAAHDPLQTLAVSSKRTGLAVVDGWSRRPDSLSAELITCRRVSWPSTVEPEGTIVLIDDGEQILGWLRAEALADHRDLLDTIAPSPSTGDSTDDDFEDFDDL